MRAKNLLKRAGHDLNFVLNLWFCAIETLLERILTKRVYNETIVNNWKLKRRYAHLRRLRQPPGPMYRDSLHPGDDKFTVIHLLPPLVHTSIEYLSL